MSAFFEVNQDNFSSAVQQSSLPVLLEFGAPWCGPCKRMEPILEQLAAEWQGKVRLMKMDVDDNVDLVMQFDVRTVPTILLIKNGAEVARLIGLQPREKLVEKLFPLI